jgi:hypothetical protein
VVYRPRRGGESKTPLVRTAARYLYEILRLRLTEFRDMAPWTPARPFYLEPPASSAAEAREREPEPEPEPERSGGVSSST